VGGAAAADNPAVGAILIPPEMIPVSAIPPLSSVVLMTAMPCGPPLTVS